MRRLGLLFAVTSLVLCSSACFAKKAVTVPMRVVGAAASVVPVVGDVTHDVVDGAADAVDSLP